ncbi:MAG: tRNA (guanosine(37)-N1)-methyltransferase TrmD [Candidatus Margulisbacteria bacterium]|nr:tRNA (guanosine(37)-N1)-methyltransferase TrmD [Candidatus Margulisiibacteriota bacterium]
MKIHIISLFPSELRDFFCKGLFLKAIKNKHLSVTFHDLREQSHLKNKSVDDYPYGKRRGLILKADIVSKAIRAIDQYQEYPIIYTCPKAPLFTQRRAESLSQEKGMIILSGYYEGVDERLFSIFDIQRMSLGDMVLSSGESPAIIIAEATARLVKGVVGNRDCIVDDSFSSGLLECPHFTAPRQVENIDVPPVLLSGHHQLIQGWERKEALRATLYQKPGLLNELKPKVEDKNLLTSLLKET